MIKTRHLGDGKISQTIDGKVVYRGRSRDFTVSPDSHHRSASYTQQPKEFTSFDCQGNV